MPVTKNSFRLYRVLGKGGFGLVSMGEEGGEVGGFGLVSMGEEGGEVGGFGLVSMGGDESGGRVWRR